MRSTLRRDQIAWNGKGIPGQRSMRLTCEIMRQNVLKLQFFIAQPVSKSCQMSVGKMERVGIGWSSGMGLVQLL